MTRMPPGPPDEEAPKNLTDFSEGLTAREYLAHRYEASELPSLPLADEGFVREWEIWLASKRAAVPDVDDIFSDEAVASWLQETPAGRIPVLYASSRTSFERAMNVLYPGVFSTGIQASVNAFTVQTRHPALCGHRVILLNKAGYSSLSGKEVGMSEEEWHEKSLTIRLNHEVCHYFSLRVLGGMQNHVLDEIAADCVGQLAAFGTYNASLQRRFFGISESGGDILPGNRFSFYVKKLLINDSIREVLEETNAALSGLESYLSKNPYMLLESNRPHLTIKILSAGIRGIHDLTSISFVSYPFWCKDGARKRERNKKGIGEIS